MSTFRTRLFASPLAFFSFLANACSDGSNASEFVIDFLVSTGERELPCSAIAEIDEVEVTFSTETGATVLAGYPKAADCALGTFRDAPVAGTHRVDVTARGKLDADPRATLFKGRANVSIPKDTHLALVLEPQVAFLEVSWAFGDAGLDPCSGEVDSVRVIVSAGAVANFRGTFACDAAPIAVPTPLALNRYTVKVEALSAAGFPLYEDTAVLLVDAGMNRHAAVLAPQGGRIAFDWQFEIDETEGLACDHARVGLSSVRASVSVADGGGTIAEDLACDASSPHAFRSARYAAGRELTLELEAEGVHRFRATREFTMPMGDWNGGTIVLEAVGSATLAFALSTTSTCAETDDVTGYAIDILHVRRTETKHTRNVARGQPYAVAFENLPYGTWAITVRQRVADQVRCRVEGVRWIDERSNVWAPLEF